MTSPWEVIGESPRHHRLAQNRWGIGQASWHPALLWLPRLPPAVDGKPGDPFSQQTPRAWRPYMCQQLLRKGWWLIAHHCFGPRSNNTDYLPSWIQMAEKCKREMMLTGINAQSANRYGVAVILCPTGLLFELFLFHCNWVIFTLTIFKTILNSQGSELNYLYSVLNAFLVQTGTQICRATQPHLVGDFPKQVSVSTTDTSTTFNSFHSPDFSSPRHPHPDIPEQSGSLCILKCPSKP